MRNREEVVNTQIDKVICAALRLSSFMSVRALLAREPGLTGRRIATRPS